MKRFILDEHSEKCKENCKRHEGFWSGHEYCHKNPKQLLFFFNNDFYFIQIPECLIGYDEYADYVDFLQQIIKKSKIKANVYSGCKNADDDFKKFRVNGIAFKRSIIDINYMYGSNNQYCLCSKADYFDKLIDSDKLKENYQLAIKEIKEMDIWKDHLLMQLENLYYANLLFVPSWSKEIIKTTDELIKQINNYGNN